MSLILTNGVQIRFTARFRDAIDKARKAAIDNSGKDEGAPGLRPHYGPDYFGAYYRDPKGNKLCFAHTPELAAILA